MTRRRWIQQPDGSLVEVDPHSGGTPRNGNGDDAYGGTGRTTDWLLLMAQTFLAAPSTANTLSKTV